VFGYQSVTIFLFATSQYLETIFANKLPLLLGEYFPPEVPPINKTFPGRSLREEASRLLLVLRPDCLGQWAHGAPCGLNTCDPIALRLAGFCPTIGYSYICDSSTPKAYTSLRAAGGSTDAYSSEGYK
jgi:hypothetical protein